jgi:signal transduction histidine kinase
MSFIKDLKKESRDLGIPIWKLPDVVLVTMALVNIIVMIATYVLATRYDNDPGKVIVLVAIEAAVITIIGNVLSESAKKIVETNRLKKEFIQIISHQMRSPLTTMKWQLELLRKKDAQNLTKKQMEQIDKIYEENGRLTTMIGDILNMSRVDKNIEHMIYSDIILENAVNECITILAGFAKFKKIVIDFKPSKKGNLVCVDNEKMKIGIVSVIENAISYSKKGKSIKITVKPEGKYVELKIKDHGIGIKVGEQEIIFNKFYRGEGGIKIQPEGTGLGLFMAKKVIEQMGGNINLQSKEGNGSEFSLRFLRSKKK